jgi:hypothetical protein
MPRLYVTGSAVEEFNEAFDEWEPNEYFKPKTKTNFLRWLLEVLWMYEDLDR